MAIKIDCRKKDPYDAVADVILKKYPYTNESFIVELQIKYAFEKAYTSLMELLSNDGYDWEHPNYVWESDWYEGQDDIILVAAAPIGEINLQPEWEINPENTHD